MERPPLLILLSGAAGTGKSSLARALGERLGLAVIDKDDVKDLIYTYFTDTNVSGALSYEVMWKMAETQLALGHGVICDSPLSGRQAMERVFKAVKKHSAALYVVHCYISDRRE